jgi:CheY-like chemotaxis protein
MLPTILFVDDDKEDEELMRECLEKLGFVNFSFCPNGKTALSHLATLAYDQLPNLVVSDLQLPDIDGLELAKALNTHEGYGGMWVVIYSGSLTPSIKTKLKEAGVVEIFQKPSNVQELNSILTRVIQLAHEHNKQLTSL